MVGGCDGVGEIGIEELGGGFFGGKVGEGF